jgi:hypothetical protein
MSRKAMGRLNDQPTAYFAPCNGVSNIPDNDDWNNKGLICEEFLQIKNFSLIAVEIAQTVR